MGGNCTVSASVLSIVLKKTARPSPKACFLFVFLNAPKELSLPNNEADVTQGIHP